jgi:hypothetical protein
MTLAVFLDSLTLYKTSVASALCLLIFKAIGNVAGELSQHLISSFKYLGPHFHS